MDEYFIKVVDAPGLIHMVGKEAPVEFSYRAKNQCDQFSKCTGFLLYEKYRQYEGGIGAKSIFAIGQIKIPVEIKSFSPPNCNVEGKDFPIEVMTIINKTLPAGRHHYGLSIQEINKICPSLNFRPRPKVGGLYPISKEQFGALSTELKSRN